MMKNDLQELLGRVRVKVGTTDKQTQALLARITTDAAILSARAAAGEHVETELLHLKAQASNLSAEFQTVVSQELRTWLLEKVGFVIAAALTG